MDRFWKQNFGYELNRIVHIKVLTVKVPVSWVSQLNKGFETIFFSKMGILDAVLHRVQRDNTLGTTNRASLLKWLLNVTWNIQFFICGKLYITYLHFGLFETSSCRLIYPVFYTDWLFQVATNRNSLMISFTENFI